jgi:hypothetical protein
MRRVSHVRHQDGLRLYDTHIYFYDHQFERSSYIITWYGVTKDRVLNWILDLLATYRL